MDQFEGKGSLRFYRKHICPLVEIIERNHRAGKYSHEREGKTQKEKKKRLRLERRSLSFSFSVFFSLEELASRGSESQRLSLTHCNVSTFLSGGAMPRRGFIKQFLAAADPKNPPWKMTATDSIDQFFSRKFPQARRFVRFSLLSEGRQELRCYAIMRISCRITFRSHDGLRE